MALKSSWLWITILNKKSLVKSGEMKWLKSIAPKSFLGKFALQKGAKYVGVYMCGVSIICIIVFVVEMLYYKHCDNCILSVLHHAYSFSIMAIVDNLCMFIINVWFIWGVVNLKSSVVLSWVVITTIWGLQGTCLVLILLCLSIKEFSLSWISALVFSVVGFFITAYCILIGYGYWLELKRRAAREEVVPATTTA